jgi:hypothetical protein
MDSRKQEVVSDNFQLSLKYPVQGKAPLTWVAHQPFRLRRNKLLVNGTSKSSTRAEFSLSEEPGFEHSQVSQNFVRFNIIRKCGGI